MEEVLAGGSCLAHEGGMPSPFADKSTLARFLRAGLLGLAVAAPASALLAQSAAVTPSASLDVTVAGISSDKGVVRLAICPPDSGFPDCGKRAVRTAVVPVLQGQARANFAQLAPGAYAVSAFHDANANGRLDTFLGIPREGFGFSRNPAIHMRAPRFGEAQIPLKGASATSIDLRYIF